MTHFYEGKDGMRADVTDNGSGYNLMLDNIHLGNPKTHTFAGILIPKQDAASFIAKLAQAMGIEIEVPGELPETAVEVYDNTKQDWYLSGESKYTVTGDLHDFLNNEEFELLQRKHSALGLEPTGRHSANLMVTDWLKYVQPWTEMGPDKTVDFEFDPESSCFYAYTDNEDDAKALADTLNKKKFLE